MPDLPAAEVYALRKERGYGVIKIVDGIFDNEQVVWAAPWPPPADMMLVVSHRGPHVLEMPSEPEHLDTLRLGQPYGWAFFRLERGEFSTVGDAIAKESKIRFAYYHQKEAFTP